MKSTELKRFERHFLDTNLNPDPVTTLPSWWADTDTALLCRRLDALEKEGIRLYLSKRKVEPELRELLSLYLEHLRLLPDSFVNWLQAVPFRFHSVLTPSEQITFIYRGKSLTKNTFADRAAFERIFPGGEVPSEVIAYRAIYPMPDAFFQMKTQDIRELAKLAGRDLGGWPRSMWLEYDTALIFLIFLIGLGCSWAWELVEERYLAADSPEQWIENNGSFLCAAATKIPSVKEWGGRLMQEQTPGGVALAKLCANLALQPGEMKSLPWRDFTLGGGAPTQEKSKLSSKWGSIAMESLPPSERFSINLRSLLLKAGESTVETIGEEIAQLELVLEEQSLSFFLSLLRERKLEELLGFGLLRGFVSDALVLTLEHFGVLDFTASAYPKSFPNIVDAALKLWVLGSDHIFARAAEHMFRYSLTPVSRAVGGENNRHEPIATMFTTTLTDLLRLPEDDDVFKHVVPFSLEERVFVLMALGELGTSKCERFLGHARKHAKRADNELLVHTINAITAKIRQRRQGLSPRERMDRVGVLLRVLNRIRCKKEVSVKDGYFALEIKEDYGIEKLI